MKKIFLLLIVAISFVGCNKKLSRAEFNLIVQKHRVYISTLKLSSELVSSCLDEKAGIVITQYDYNNMVFKCAYIIYADRIIKSQENFSNVIKVVCKKLLSPPTVVEVDEQIGDSGISSKFLVDVLNLNDLKLVYQGIGADVDAYYVFGYLNGKKVESVLSSPDSVMDTNAYLFNELLDLLKKIKFEDYVKDKN